MESLADAEIILNGLPAHAGLVGENDAIQFPPAGDLTVNGKRPGNVKVRTLFNSPLGAYFRQRSELARVDSGLEPLSLVYKSPAGEMWTCEGGRLIEGPYGPSVGSDGYLDSLYVIKFEDIAYDGSDFVGFSEDEAE